MVGRRCTLRRGMGTWRRFECCWPAARGWRRQPMPARRRCIWRQCGATARRPARCSRPVQRLARGRLKATHPLLLLGVRPMTGPERRRRSRCCSGTHRAKRQWWRAAAARRPPSSKALRGPEARGQQAAQPASPRRPAQAAGRARRTARRGPAKGRAVLGRPSARVRSSVSARLRGAVELVGGRCVQAAWTLLRW